MARRQTESYVGKLVDTWIYEYQGVATPDAVAEDGGADETSKPPVVEPIKVSIELRLHKKFKESSAPPMQTGEVWFSVRCAKPAIDLKGPDIEALRLAAWDLLDKEFAVKWERYFLVEIAPRHPYVGMGTGLEYSYDSIEKGTAFDGTLLMRQYKSREFKIVLWPGEFRNQQGRVMACIPATHQNEKALEEFSKKIAELRKMLASFLAPEAIEATLANLAGVPLLASISERAED